VIGLDGSVPLSGLFGVNALKHTKKGFCMFEDPVAADGGRGESSKVLLRTMGSNLHFIAASHSVLADKVRISESLNWCPVIGDVKSENHTMILLVEVENEGTGIVSNLKAFLLSHDGGRPLDCRSSCR